MFLFRLYEDKDHEHDILLTKQSMDSSKIISLKEIIVSLQPNFYPFTFTFLCKVWCVCDSVCECVVKTMRHIKIRNKGREDRREVLQSPKWYIIATFYSTKFHQKHSNKEFLPLLINIQQIHFLLNN